MKVQEMRTGNYHKKAVFIPKMLCQILSIEKGDDLEPKLVHFNGHGWKIEIVRKAKIRN